MMPFKDAVNNYFKTGWVCHPLRKDPNGFPKVPIAPHWQALKRDARQIRALPWYGADGLGLVLGAASGNLAVIDIDDVPLANAVFSLLVRNHTWTRLVWTVRKRIHMYVQEEQPSPSRVLKVKYEGRDIKVELKAQGTQVAAPPTPGYVLALDRPPIVVPTIRASWESICRHLPIEAVGGGSNAGYPMPWQEKVPQGERNQVTYIEGHKLREAGIPLAQALDLMRLRFEQHYDQGSISWAELERTITSAYRKGDLAKPLWEVYAA